MKYVIAMGMVLAMAALAQGAVPPAVPAPGYQVRCLPADVAPTVVTQPEGEVNIYGQPRKDTVNPCTLWDQHDINRYKRLLKTNRGLQNSLKYLENMMDRQIAQPLNVPKLSEIAGPSTWRASEINGSVIAEMGIVYALTGRQKYGNYCKQLLLTYARRYPHLRHPRGWTKSRYRSALDGRLSWQFLNDGFWLAQTAFGYDLIYNLPSWTPQERRLVRVNLFEGICAEFDDPVLNNHGYQGWPNDYLSWPNNRSCLCDAATLMAGYACHDQKLIAFALYGHHGTRSHPLGGVFGMFYTSQCILPDGMWVEGSPSYGLGIASAGLFDIAQTLWHHGVNIYSYHHAMLKRMLDAYINLAYPNSALQIPALHDGGPFSLLDKRNWLSNEITVPYECGYRHYHDPRYIPIVRNGYRQNNGGSVAMTVHAGPPMQFLRLPAYRTPTPAAVNVNYSSVGFGVLENNSPHAPNYLLLEYGPAASHAHPSKLGIALYALGHELMPFCGVIFPYNNPLDVRWYWTTLANNALTVDRQSQIILNLWKYVRKYPPPVTLQIIYAPAATMGMQRAWSDTVSPGVTQDRSLFLTPQYMADIYAAGSNNRRVYDLAWHIRGKLTAVDLALQPRIFHTPVANGYNALTAVKSADTSRPWSAAYGISGGQTVRLIAAGQATEVIMAKGHYLSLHVHPYDAFPPTIIERRNHVRNTLYGNVIDISGDAKPYVQGVVQKGGIAAGYGLLQVKTIQGTDLCFSAYRPGTYRAVGLKTNAQQALVRCDGDQVQALYLAGGTVLKVAGGQLTRSSPGLAYIEPRPGGGYVLANPSPVSATVSVTLPALAGLRAFTVRADGRLGAAAPALNPGPGGEITALLKAGFAIAFIAK